MKQIEFKSISPAVKQLRENDNQKILVNPYHGCSHNCLFCPANDGFLKRKAFDNYRDNGIIYVIENIVEHVAAYISLNKNPHKTVHLSPVADPFQPAEDQFGLSEAVIRYCGEINVPVAICTKGFLPLKIIKMLEDLKHSFVQISIPTINADKHKLVVKGDGATLSHLFNTIEELVSHNIPVIARVDPIYPFITDDLCEFEELVRKLKGMNVFYIMSSIADLADNALDREINYLEQIQEGLHQKYKALYADRINNRWHAAIDYREDIFTRQMNICKDLGLSYGITWEPDLGGNSINNLYSFINKESLNI
jgi:DNA repair photolyase